MSLFRLNGLADKLNRFRKYLLYGKRSDTASYIRALCARGAKISQDLYMPTPESVFLDDTTPFMLSIGSHVGLAAGVKVLTHDASWHVDNALTGRVTGHIAPVSIGNNVFVGMNSVILCGVSICDNVIIGAGSVVSGSIKKSGVYSGNPAKLVAPLDVFFEFREERMLSEAYTLAEKYYEAFGQKPLEELFNEYFYLFCPRRKDALNESFLRQMNRGANEKALDAFLSSEPEFESYDAFWAYCMERMAKKADKAKADKNAVSSEEKACQE